MSVNFLCMKRAKAGDDGTHQLDVHIIGSAAALAFVEKEILFATQKKGIPYVKAPVANSTRIPQGSNG